MTGVAEVLGLPGPGRPGAGAPSSLPTKEQRAGETPALRPPQRLTLHWGRGGRAPASSPDWSFSGLWSGAECDRREG